jgi:hypothetical protein
VLAKLSHRFVLTRPRWLQDGAGELLAAGAALASNPCLAAPAAYDLRTEACLLDVDRWFRPPVLDLLRPRALRTATELVVWEAFVTRVGGPLHRWQLFGIDRCRRARGILWHCANTEREYHEVARRFGVDLDADFTVGPSQGLKDYQWG